MTHRVYKSASADARLLAHKARPHGRQRNVQRVWKLRDVVHILPGAFGDEDFEGKRSVGPLRMVRR